MRILSYPLYYTQAFLHFQVQTTEKIQSMKKNHIFDGTATALVTPFRDGLVDYATLDALMDRQLSLGIGTLVVGGTTAEAATLSDKERYELFRHTADYVGGRCKLIFGTGTNDTKAAVRHTRMAHSLGCDGVLSVTPYYNKGTEEGLVRHYLTVADSVELPIILYNVPSRTGVVLSERQLDRLAEHPGIVGIKEAADSSDRLVMLARFGDRLSLFAGNDSQTYTALALGGRGVISVASNLAPRAVDRIYRLFAAGDTKESLRMQLRLLPLMRAMFLETNPTPIKYMMSLRGLCSAEMRLPMAEPTESTRAAIGTLIESTDPELLT